MRRTRVLSGSHRGVTAPVPTHVAAALLGFQIEAFGVAVVAHHDAGESLKLSTGRPQLHAELPDVIEAAVGLACADDSADNLEDRLRLPKRPRDGIGRTGRRGGSQQVAQMPVNVFELIVDGAGVCTLSHVESP